MKTMMLIKKKSMKEGDARDVDVDKEDANHGDANEDNGDKNDDDSSAKPGSAY